jgi:hypothetical protein
MVSKKRTKQYIMINVIVESAGSDRRVSVLQFWLPEVDDGLWLTKEIYIEQHA